MLHLQKVIFFNVLKFLKTHKNYSFYVKFLEFITFPALTQCTSQVYFCCLRRFKGNCDGELYR